MMVFFAQAIGLFAITNLDDLVLLSLWFGRARGDLTAERHVVVGQYLGFGAIVIASFAAAAGLRLVSEDATSYLGLIPLALGLREALEVWRERRTGEGSEDSDDLEDGAAAVQAQPLSTTRVAAVTLANGGDNIGVYVPVFATASLGRSAAFVAVFFLLIAVWCAAARWIASRPPVARALDRWGHIVLPVVLIALGLAILVEGGA